MDTSLQKINPGLFLPGSNHRVPKNSKRGKPQYTKSFQVSVSITFTNAPLVIASHMTKPKLKSEDIDSAS